MRKRRKGIKRIQESCLERAQRKLVSSLLTLEVQIMRKESIQRKAFCRQRIPKSNHARKETVDNDIVISSKNHVIYKNSEWTYHKNVDLEPVQPDHMKICQSNAYRKDLNWLSFKNRQRVQEWQQVKDQQSHIFVSSVYLSYPSSS